MDMFADIIKANQPSGLIQGISIGVVSDVADPLSMQRVQVQDMTKGSKSESDWLFRLLPFTSYSPPVPKVNDLVVIGYIDGNPHKGCYLGVIVNQNNKPVGGNDDLTIVLGGATVKLTSSGVLTAVGVASATIESIGDVKVKSQTLNAEVIGLINEI